MKNLYMLYIVGAIALVGAGHALTHLIRLGEWEPVFFLVVKDVSVAGIVIYLARRVRVSSEMSMKVLAARSILFALLVSFVADSAILLIRV